MWLGLELYLTSLWWFACTEVFENFACTWNVGWTTLYTYILVACFLKKKIIAYFWRVFPSLFLGTKHSRKNGLFLWLIFPFHSISHWTGHGLTTLPTRCRCMWLEELRCSVAKERILVSSPRASLSVTRRLHSLLEINLFGSSLWHTPCHALRMQWRHEASSTCNTGVVCL